MSNESPNIKEYIKLNVMKLAVFGISGILIIIVLLLFAFKEDAPFLETYTVTRGGVESVLVESASLKAVNSIEIRAPGGGRNRWEQSVPRILYLCPEGDIVDKSDTLIRFDTADLKTQLEDTELQLLTLQQDYEALLETHKSEEKTEERRIQDMEFSLQSARLNLELAEFEPDNVRQSKELQVRISILDSLKTLADITAKRAYRKFAKDKALDRIKNEESDIQSIKDKINSLSILAPFPGLVVYIEEGWPIPQKIKEGDSPHSWQKLIMLLDLSSIEATLHINDLDRQGIFIGQKGRLRLESYPDIVFTGKIVDMGILPQKAISYSYSNLKIIETEFLLDEADEIMRPGMSGVVELIIDDVEDVLFVPLSAVFEIKDKTYVYFVDGNNYEPREVTLGLRNENFVEVQEGLREGDIVLHTDPFGQGFKIGQYEEWIRQEESIAMLNEHFENIEELGIQYDYESNRGKEADINSGGSERMGGMGGMGGGDMSDDDIKAMLERMGREATPENIKNFRDRMKSMGGERGGRGRSGMGREGMGRGRESGRSHTGRRDTTGTNKLN